MHPVESCFSIDNEYQIGEEKINTVVVSNFIELGRLAALRFILWVIQNPEGVISLPTGKTPQFFIEWVQFYRQNWSQSREELLKFGFQKNDIEKGFTCEKLSFVQIDEFFPIDPDQTNSFFFYIQKFYLEGFGINPDKALLINPQKDLNLDLKTLFPDGTVQWDLQFMANNTLSDRQLEQKKALFEMTQYCDQYEQKIRDLGGIGFFLGGLGPDGHIGFNVAGSSHYSITRLCPVNYETQAASAGDLGGIQKGKLVMTIGLETIKANPNATIIIMAAGKAKAIIATRAIEGLCHVKNPASVLHGHKGSVFYLTRGAASGLASRDQAKLHKKEELNQFDISRILSMTALDFGLSLSSLARQHLENHPWGRILIEKLNLKADKDLTPFIEQVKNQMKQAIQRGLDFSDTRTTIHTAPHHDDLILGIFPLVKRDIQQNPDQTFVSVLTSGFTAVTSGLLSDMVERSRIWLDETHVDFNDFTAESRVRDCNYFLQGKALDDSQIQMKARIQRFIRDLILLDNLQNWTNVKERLTSLADYLQGGYPGQKDPESIQILKGALREFEEELLWVSHGLKIEQISHPRLPFYKGDIFNQDPDQTDAEFILTMLEKLKPRCISLALDPEGSGPDTHFKVLLAVNQAVQLFMEKQPDHPLEILGYRNVWNRFEPWEAHAVYPTSLPDLNEIDRDFKAYYFSQVTAPFPSPDYFGPFSEFSQKIWVEQKEEWFQLLGQNEAKEQDKFQLPKEWEYAQGAIFFQILTPQDLHSYAREHQGLPKD